MCQNGSQNEDFEIRKLRSETANGQKVKFSVLYEISRKEEATHFDKNILFIPDDWWIVSIVR